jgi:methyl-accepting chemotaxis protein
MRFTRTIKAKQIVASAGLIVAISASIGTFAYIGSASILEQELETSLGDDAERLAECYDSWIGSQLLQMETLAANVEFDLTPRMDDILAAEAKRIGFNSMAPADMTGILHLANGKKADISGRPYLKQVFAEQKPAISEPVFSAVAGEENLLTVLLAVPIFQNGVLAGALVGQRNAEFMSEKLKQMAYGAGSTAFIVGSGGYPIAHTDMEQVRKRESAAALAERDPRMKPFADIAARMIAGEKGIDKYEFEGGEIYVGFAPIADLGWSVGITAPEQTVMAPLHRLVKVFLLIAAVAVAVGIAFAFALGSAFAKPVKMVADIVDGIAQGDADLTQRIELKRETRSASSLRGSMPSSASSSPSFRRSRRRRRTSVRSARSWRPVRTNRRAPSMRSWPTSRGFGGSPPTKPRARNRPTRPWRLSRRGSRTWTR